MIATDLHPLAYPLEKLHLLPGNPRRGNVDAVKRSLEAFGQRKPIVARRSDRVVIAGNHTLQAAQALGWSEIAVVWVDDDDTTSKAFALADNRTAELGDYDEAALAELIGQVGSVDPDLLVASGWDAESVSDLLDGLQGDLPLDVDEIPEQVPAISKLGDVWLLGEHRVMCGDSSDEKMIDALLNKKIIQMIFTDPPYGMELDTDFTKMGDTGKAHRKVANDDKQFDASLIVRKFANCKEIFLWGADYYVETLQRQYPNLGSWIIWDKYSDERIGLLDGRFGSTFETCWSKTKHKREIARVLVTTNYTSRGDETRVHPTQKPVALAKWFFDRWGNEKDIVLDLFGGSGSTLIAAQETNRIAYLMELDPHYVDVICARFQKVTGIVPINEASGREHDFLNG